MVGRRRGGKMPRIEELDQTIIFKAKGLLPVISRAIGELEVKRGQEAKVKLLRLRKWEKVLQNWQDEEELSNISNSSRIQRLEEMRDLLVWDSENYE